MQMDTQTHFEDLSNEIFFEIFDYLHALDIFTAFTSLNKRILSILQSIRLHVIILDSHFYEEIDFLSSHLTFHAHQVISLNCYDTIRDRSSIISLLFKRHHFINLRSCIIMSIHPLTELENVLEQVASLNRLVSFFIQQPNDKNVHEKDQCNLIRTTFKHKSSSLRSVKLHYYSAYMDIINYNSIASNITSLHLLISFYFWKTASIYAILSILRVCPRLRCLHAVMEEYCKSTNMVVE